MKTKLQELFTNFSNELEKITKNFEKINNLDPEIAVLVDPDKVASKKQELNNQLEEIKTKLILGVGHLAAVFYSELEWLVGVDTTALISQFDAFENLIIPNIDELTFDNLTTYLEPLRANLSGTKLEEIQQNLDAAKKQSEENQKQREEELRNNIDHQISELRKIFPSFRNLETLPEISRFISEAQEMIKRSKPCPRTSLETVNNNLISKIQEYRNDIQPKLVSADLENLGKLAEGMEEPLKTSIIDKINEIVPPAANSDLGNYTNFRTETTIIEITTIIDTYWKNEIIANFGYALTPESIKLVEEAISDISQQQSLSEKLNKLTKAITEVNYLQRYIINQRFAKMENGKLVHNLGEPNPEIMHDEIVESLRMASNLNKPVQERQETLIGLSTRIEQLQRKNGVFEPHQRKMLIAIQRNAQELEIQNQKTISENLNMYGQGALDALIANLNKYRDITKNSSAGAIKRQEKNIFQATNKGGIFGHFSKWNGKKIEELIGERKAIIERIQHSPIEITRMSALSELESKGKIITSTEDYQRQYTEQLRDLERVDTQLFGYETVKSIYRALNDKATHLVGGTRLVLPQSLIDVSILLEEGLKNTQSKVTR